MMIQNNVEILDDIPQCMHHLERIWILIWGKSSLKLGYYIYKFQDGSRVYDYFLFKKLDDVSTKVKYLGTFDRLELVSNAIKYDLRGD